MSVIDPSMPNFFVLGVAKSGTTTLYAYLVQHPEIFMPKEKEPHFFNDDEIFGLGVSNYLSRHFQGADLYEARGEGTPAYFTGAEKVARRLKSVYGDQEMKFIIIFRNPVDRAWSHYLHMKRIGAESESFETALQLEAERIEERPDGWFGYFSDGLYYQQLKVWLEFFPKEQFFFLLTTDLASRLEHSLDEVCRFLNVEEFNHAELNVDVRKNAASEARNRHLMHFLANPPSWVKRIVLKVVRKPTRRAIIKFLRRKNLRPQLEKPVMSLETRAMLSNRYLPDIEQLETIIGRDLSQWKVESK